MPRRFGCFSRVPSFHDLPLWAKVLVVPAACLVASVAAAASIWLAATETEGRLAEIANRGLPTAAASAQLLDSVDTVQAMAMRAMVWQQAGVPQATVDSLSKDVERALAKLRASAAGMATGLAEGDADLPLLTAIAT